MGLPIATLTSDELAALVVEGIEALDLSGKRVLVIVPDGTRSMPLAQMCALLAEHLAPRVAAMDYLVALGTHMLMDEQAMLAEALRRAGGERYVWAQPGVQPPLDGRGHLRPARDHPGGRDQRADGRALRAGGTGEGQPPGAGLRAHPDPRAGFPARGGGLLGGNKYFFPGVAGPEIIHFTHWLGAVLTNFRIIGSGYTPARAVIDRAGR